MMMMTVIRFLFNSVLFALFPLVRRAFYDSSRFLRDAVVKLFRL